MRTLEELKSIDDGGSFDRLVKNMEEAANGNESLKVDLLTDYVLGGFIDMHFRKVMDRKLLVERNHGVEFVNLNFKTPRKIRSNVTDPPIAKVQTNNESMKRGYFGVVEEEEEEEAVKKPEVKKQRKADECLEKKERKKKTTIINKYNLDDQLGLNPPPDLPQEFKDRIEKLNGTNIILLIQKTLTKSDIHSQQGRFAMPRGQMTSHDFLTEEETHELSQKRGIQCSLIHPCLEEITNLEFKRWDMGKTFSYMLIGGWKFVSYNTRNQLEIGSKVQLWSFRVGSNLWFALVKLQQEDDRDTSSTGVSSM